MTGTRNNASLLLPVLFVAALAVSILPSCRSPERSTDHQKENLQLIENSYAENFTIATSGEDLVLTVLSPWQKAGTMRFSYLLKQEKDSTKQPVGLVEGTEQLSPEDEQTVVIPVSKVVVTSTTHISYLKELGQSQSIIGVSGGRYIYDGELSRNFNEGGIRDIGYDQGLNYELIISMQPDVVFVYGITGEIYSHISRFRKLGIPVVVISEYLEKHPLGKAEWIRFFAAFYHMNSVADSIFRVKMQAYESLTKLTATITGKPSILSGLPWKDTWWVPGGSSFAAKLIADAGGDYLWKDNDSFEAIPLDIEAVYTTAGRADIWINPGSAMTSGEIIASDARLGEFKAVTAGRVYNNNARMNNHGGNDYWESGVCRPELILADLMSIFHPSLLPGHQLYYYRQLSKEVDVW